MLIFTIGPRTLSLCTVALLSIGCAHIQTLIAPRTATTDDIGSDTVYLQVTEAGFAESAKEAVIRQLTLRGEGSEVLFRLGDPVSLIFEGVNVDSHTVETTLDEENNTVTMRVLSRRSGVVSISKKCQTFIYSSLRNLPLVEIKPGLDPEQIVVTPLCDKDGNIYAYELRYGSTQRGCTNVARTGLERFKQCSRSVQEQPQKPITRRKQLTPKTYFGL